jgi:transmembrane sensor
MLKDHVTDRECRAAAIGWWVRLDAGALSHAELLAFRAWIARDPAHEAAFEDICDLWGDLEGLRNQIPSFRAKPRRRLWLLPAGAAALALCLWLGAGELSVLWRADFSTGTGEVRTVTLEDGSRVELNARTAIAKDFSSGQRRLTLLRGEAWFDVAPDPSRPFTVEAGGGFTTALGTSFDIAMEKARTDVTVTEHKVMVAAAGRAVTAGAGEQTAYGPGLPVLAPYPSDVESATAWRRGKLIFQDKPLGEVIASLGHYHRGIVWAAPSIRDRRVSGVFSTAKPLEALRAIELSLGLRALYLGDYLVLLRP